MQTHSTDSPANSSDTTKVRQDLCKALASGIRENAFGSQVRFVRKQDGFSDVWFYLYRNHEWRKQYDFAVDAAAIPELFAQLQIVDSREYADAWNCRRTDHHDRTDFELKFHPESIQAHIKSNLESYLMGCLFMGHHDSGQDSRRRIRFQER